MDATSGDRKDHWDGLVAKYEVQTRGVRGWLSPTDIRLFLHLSRLQRWMGIVGDILEIGVFEGKSAILLGFCRSDDEQLVVCDLFEDVADVGDRLAQSRAYKGLTMERFLRNFQRCHDRAPEVHACPSAALSERGLERSFRVVHIDGGHTYDQVRSDATFARSVLERGGIVVFDDYVTPHTPGVAAVVWEDVASHRLVPLALSNHKFYGTWDVGDSAPRAVDLLDAVQGDPQLQNVEWQSILGFNVLRFDVDPMTRRPWSRRLLRAFAPPVLGDLARTLRSRTNAGRT